LVDWALSESAARGLDELLLLDPEGRVISSARWPEGSGEVHPHARLLQECVPGTPLVWRSPDPRRPREDPWLIGMARSRSFGGRVALVAIGQELEGDRAQVLRVDLELDALHLGPPRVGRGERAFAWPIGWTPFPEAVLSWDPGPAPSVRALEGLRPWLIAAALCAVVVVLLGAPWVAAGLGRPLLQMADAVGAIGRGVRHPDLPRTGPREIRVMRDALLQLTRDLDAAELRIRQAERRAAWREIARRIAHEIRNSLSPLALAVDNVETAVLRDDPRARAALQASLATARDQLQSLERLVSEFSSFARQPRLVIAPFAVHDLVESCASTLRASRADVQLHVDAADAPDTAHGDAEQLRRAVHNLLKNAAEAAPDTLVELRAGRGANPDSWWVAVGDRGPGLPAAIRARLGDPYLTTKSEGTGLGLPIVMRIVEAHGGAFSLESRTAGGTLARIELPLVPPLVTLDDVPEAGRTA
jgi:signal transduction histidine kinase